MNIRVGVITATAVIAIALLAWWLWPSAANESETPTAIVTRATVEETVTAQGTLEPKEYVDVGTQVSGQLEKLHVEVGDTVEKGQLLAEIDPTVYQSRVDVDRARIKNLEASTALAKLNHARNETLFAANAVSKQEYETSLATLKSAQAQLEEQRYTLQGDLANLGYTKIYAPINGTVTTQTTREGQTVNASQSAPTIVQVANLAVMTVRADVAEADIARIKAGMSATFTTLGSDKRWKGTVRQVLPAPDATTTNVVLYNVLIDADNESGELLTGMTTQVFFELGRAENVLSIPASALGKHLAEQDNEQGAAYLVRVQNGSKVEPRTVRIGLISRTSAEVKSGLNEGEIVLTSPAPTRDTNPIRSGGGRGMGGPRL